MALKQSGRGNEMRRKGPKEAAVKGNGKNEKTLHAFSHMQNPDLTNLSPHTHSMKAEGEIFGLLFCTLAKLF